jgi:predicted O-linked N-acetylglucosamine transferase (SPINDLY family)
VNASVRALCDRGTQYLQHGQPQVALEYFDQALNGDSDDIIALISRGLALQGLNRFDEAFEMYTRALSIKPGLAGALANRSNSLRSLQRFDEALLDLDTALTLGPEFPEALNNRGNVLRDLNRLEEAVASFDAALAQRPDFPMALSNRGNALLDLGRPREALNSFETALQLDPDDAEGLFGRASARLALKQELEGAVNDFDRAARHGIELSEVLVGKASALAELRRHGEAAKCLLKLRNIAPEREYALGSLLHSLQQACDWTPMPALVSELESLVRAGRKAVHPQSLLSLTDSAELHLRCAQILAADKHPEDMSLGPCLARASRGTSERIRIAYVSADFREHPVSELLVGVLEQHDRRRFEIIGVSLQAGPGGPFEQRVRAAFDRFLDVAADSDREIAASLRELEVDIAVDLMGYTRGMRPGIHAHRAAPLQVNWLGYSGTSGAPYMDYLIADAVVIPPGEEGWYTEQIVRLPHSFFPNDSKREIAPPPSRTQAGLPAKGFVFCAFTSAYKISAPVFEVWMSLLRQVPGSVLWLRAFEDEARGHLQREALRLGVAKERLVFAPRLASMAEHLGRHSLADLYLDTLPYNAHSTACDALWAGVPVLTCAGQSFPSRAAASALHAVGLPELITHSLEEYEREALELARDPPSLQSLRARLERNRANAPLFDTVGFTRHLESVYLDMQRSAVRGEGNPVA